MERKCHTSGINRNQLEATKIRWKDSKKTSGNNKNQLDTLHKADGKIMSHIWKQ